MSYPLRNDALTLYAITDRYWLNSSRLADVVENVLKNGATFLQLREKEFSHGDQRNCCQVSCSVRHQR